MAKAAAADLQQVLTFRVGSTQLAVAASEVSEIVRRPKLARVPHAPASLAGIASLRGAVVPILSLAGLMGHEASPVTAASRILLLALDEPVGIAVDSVGALTTLKAPGRGRKRGTLFIEGEDAVRVIDLGALLEQEFAALARRDRKAEKPATDAGTVQQASDALSFLTFEVAGQSYALPLDEVGEAMAVPDRIASISRQDAAILGVVPVREILLPVISLRVLLGFPAEAPRGGNERIVVARIGNAGIGLLVDRLQAILRTSPDAVEPVPPLLNRGAGEAQIISVCRLQDGRGLVSILSAARLFRDETVASILADSSQETPGMSYEAEDRAGEQIVVFRLGDEEYGLPIGAVDEVVSLPENLVRVPRAPAFVEGVMNLRGKVLPVIDQRRRFGVGAAAALRPRLIVTTIGDRQAGFIVDSVSEILTVAADQLGAAPALTVGAGRLFDRIANIEIGGRMILLIDPQALLDRAERDLLAALDTTAPAVS